MTEANMEKPRFPYVQIGLLLAAVIGLIFLLTPRPAPIPLGSPIIAYDRPGGSIHLMNLECIYTQEGCKDAQQLLFRSSSDREIIFHHWSPNGKHILFFQGGRWYFPFEGFAQINPKTAQVQSLFTVPLPHDRYTLYYYAALSPDGKRFIFTNHEEPLPRNIYISDIDGTHQRPLISINNRIERVSWSPDGRYMTYEIVDPSLDPSLQNEVFLNALQDETFDMGRVRYTSLWIANVDGTNPHLLAKYAINAVWSPNSSHLLYSASTGQYPLNLNLMSVRPDGSDLKQLTDGAADHSPVWSPDGQTIAYLASPEIPWPYDMETGDLMLMQPDGSNKRKLNTPDLAANMVWSPDSRYMTYLTYVPRYPNLPAYPDDVQLFVTEVQNDQHYQLTFDRRRGKEGINVIWRP
jgi:Tol biopolymer transport system component